MSSYDFLESLGISSLVSFENWQDIPSLREFTTAAMIFNADNLLDFMRVLFLEDGIEDRIETHYDEIQTIGRNIPIYGFKNTSGRNINVKMYFNAHVLPIAEVWGKIKWLRRFQYPRDDTTTIKPPNKIIFCAGTYLWVKGVVKSVSATQLPPYGGIATKAGFLPMFPHRAEVDLVIGETEELFSGEQMTYEKAENEANFRLPFSIPSFVRSAINLL